MHSIGSLSLLFNWGDVLTLNNGYSTRSVNVGRVSLQSRQMILAGDLHAFGILFRPGGAFPLFGIPMHELTDADSLYTFKLSELQEYLYDIPNFQGRVGRVESWLTDLLRTNCNRSRVVHAALEKIGLTHGQYSIEQIASDVDIGERQLERVFKNEVGITPKAYSSLVRLHYARLVLKRNESTPLAALGQLAGYYDQAHFCREFKKIVGITPGEYLSRQRNRQAIQAEISGVSRSW